MPIGEGIESLGPEVDSCRHYVQSSLSIPRVRTNQVILTPDRSVLDFHAEDMVPEFSMTLDRVQYGYEGEVKWKNP